MKINRRTKEKSGHLTQFILQLNAIIVLWYLKTSLVALGNLLSAAVISQQNWLEVAWLVSKYIFSGLNVRLATCVITPLPGQESLTIKNALFIPRIFPLSFLCCRRKYRSMMNQSSGQLRAQPDTYNGHTRNVRSEIRKILHLFWLPGHYFYWARDGTNGKIFVLKLNCKLGSQTQVSHDRRWELTRHSIPGFWVRVMVFWWFLPAPLYFGTSILSFMETKVS